jgi:hypothetical protein
MVPRDSKAAFTEGGEGQIPAGRYPIDDSAVDIHANQQASLLVL